MIADEDMITDDIEIQFTAAQLQHVVREYRATRLNDRQAEALAVYVNELQCKIDDLSDKCDSLQKEIEYMEQHPKGCECRDCRIP